MRRPSIVRADKIFSIGQSIVLASFGRINVETHGRILAQIQALVASP